MRHKWLTDGCESNFCLKCGILKSRAYGRKCPMTEQNLEKKLAHSFERNEGYSALTHSYHDKVFERAVHTCAICKIQNRTWGKHIISISNEENATPYVIYVEKMFKTRKIMRVHSMYYADPIDKDGKNLEVKFWPIYCPYSKNEVDVMDILL